MSNELASFQPEPPPRIFAAFYAYDEVEAKRYAKVLDLCELVYEVEQMLRKVADIERGDEATKAVDSIREMYYQLKEDAGINLDELYQ